MGWFTLDDVELQPEQQQKQPTEQGGNESEPPPFAQQASQGYNGMLPS